MKNFKKLLSVMIAALVLFSALPMAAVSAADVVTYDVVCSEEDVVSLSFTPQEDGYYVFYTDCDENTCLCLYGEVDGEYVSYWAEDASAANDNFRLRVKLNKGEYYRLDVTVWNSDPCEFTVFAEPADKYIVSGEVVKEPTLNYAIEGAESDSIFLEGAEVEFTYSDGTKETFTYDEGKTLALMHVDGSVLDYYADDMKDTVYITCDDAVVEWKYNVKPNPVDYIEYTGDPIVLTENMGGLYESEDVFYYTDYSLDQNDTFVVYYTDGTSEEIVASDRMSMFRGFGEYPVTLAQDQYLVPWTAGGENYAYLLYLGKEAAVPVEIIPAEDSDISDAPDSDSVTAGETYEVVYQGAPVYMNFTPENDGYYLLYTVGEADTFITVYDSEGWYVDMAEDTSAEDLNAFLRVYLNGGESYTIQLESYADLAGFAFCAESTDIYAESGYVSLNPAIDYVYEGAELESLVMDGIEITYTMSDGSTVVYVCDPMSFCGHVYGAYVEYYYDAETNQVIFICDDTEVIFVPTVVENPVERIEYTGDSIVLIENENMIYDDETGESYYFYDIYEDGVINVYYKDGTSEVKYLNDMYYGGYMIDVYDNQWETPWTVGGENYIYLSYLGVETQVYVKILGEDDVVVDDSYIVGDANRDKVVNVKDATFIQKGIAELIEMDVWNKSAADVDYNGVVNIKDATAIQKYVAGIDTGLDIGSSVE